MPAVSNRLMGARRDPIGVILAGGGGRRIGGSKAMVALQGQPLVCYPLAAMTQALAEVAVLAKADTKLPSLRGVTVWIEPAGPTHPLYGIIQALALGEGRAVLVCATDLPFVSPALIRRIVDEAVAVGAPAVVAAQDGQMQPLLGCYQPAAAGMLAAPAPEVSLRAAVEAIGPRLVEVEEPEELFNINAPEDLLQAAAMLDGRSGYPKVKS
jgi:molybdopterin-guanine dinucleotide biosynthesis protein A